MRDLVAATAAALKQLPAIAHQTANAELVSIVGEFDELAALGTAGVVTMTAEAEQRGVIAASQCASTAAWVRDAAWHLQTGGSVVVAKCVTILRRHDLAVLADAIQTTDFTPTVAATIAAEFDKISPDLADGAGPVVLDKMIGMGADHGPRSVKQLRQLLLAQYGLDGAFQDEQDSKHRCVEQSAGTEDNGVFHYELTLDAEGGAVLEAAIGPMSKPQPEPDGTPDLRPVGRRRGEALIEVCRRATAAGGQVPAAVKAALYVTMTLNELRNAIGAATTVGSVDAGALLAPETARKLACDASIIPIVLGSDSEILDEGRAQRLFTAPQLKALWLRDKHCTFPGCEAPAHWGDAHHLKHGIDGGPTDLDNGALLCGRHHTIVHRDQLAGTLVDGQVLWDRRPGSYQRSPATSMA
ncbi:MAG: HNH endonuclease [Actinomycetota bacterium]|nr:HNH endonuclease [Actinomycetota bacterium]